MRCRGSSNAGAVRLATADHLNKPSAQCLSFLMSCPFVYDLGRLITSQACLFTPGSCCCVQRRSTTTRRHLRQWRRPRTRTTVLSRPQRGPSSFAPDIVRTHMTFVGEHQWGDVCVTLGPSMLPTQPVG